MRLYIAGPMTGIKDFNYPLFFEAAEQLRKQGHDVLNPADRFDGDTTLSHELYLRASIVDMLVAQGIGLLPYWHTSVGASTELHISDTLGLPSYDIAVEDDYRLIPRLTTTYYGAAAQHLTGGGKDSLWAESGTLRPPEAEFREDSFAVPGLPGWEGHNIVRTIF